MRLCQGCYHLSLTNGMKLNNFLIANAILYLSYDIFAFACIDKGTYCQDRAA